MAKRNLNDAAKLLGLLFNADQAKTNRLVALMREQVTVGDLLRLHHLHQLRQFTILPDPKTETPAKDGH